MGVVIVVAVSALLFVAVFVGGFVAAMAALEKDEEKP